MWIYYYIHVQIVNILIFATDQTVPDWSYLLRLKSTPQFSFNYHTLMLASSHRHLMFVCRDVFQSHEGPLD